MVPPLITLNFIDRLSGPAHSNLNSTRHSLLYFLILRLPISRFPDRQTYTFKTHYDRHIGGALSQVCPHNVSSHANNSMLSQSRTIIISTSCISTCGYADHSVRISVKLSGSGRPSQTRFGSGDQVYKKFSSEPNFSIFNQQTFYGPVECAADGTGPGSRHRTSVSS